MDPTPTCVTLITVADDLSVPVILVAGSSKVAATVRPLRTRTRPALATGWEAQHRVAVVAVGAPVKKSQIMENAKMFSFEAISGRNKN